MTWPLVAARSRPHTQAERECVCVRRSKRREVTHSIRETGGRESVASHKRSRSPSVQPSEFPWAATRDSPSPYRDATGFALHRTGRAALLARATEASGDTELAALMRALVPRVDEDLNCLALISDGAHQVVFGKAFYKRLGLTPVFKVSEGSASLV